MKRSLATRLTLLATAMGAFAALPAAAQTPPATTGDTPRTAEVVAEVAASTLTERGATRADDRISEAAMEDRKKEGYF